MSNHLARVRVSDTPILIGAALLLAAVLFGGCTTAYTATASSLTAAERVVQAAVEQYPGLDRAKRKDINAHAKSVEEGMHALAAWDETSDKIAVAINGAHASVKLAADGLKGVRDGLRDPKDLSKWIGPALRVGLDLVSLLGAVGLELKGVPR